MPATKTTAKVAIVCDSSLHLSLILLCYGKANFGLDQKLKTRNMNTSLSEQRVAQALAGLGLTGIPIECGWGQPDDAVAHLAHWAQLDGLSISSIQGGPVGFLVGEGDEVNSDQFKAEIQKRFPGGLSQILARLECDEKHLRSLKAM